jgi:hypothetical protein
VDVNAYVVGKMAEQRLQELRAMAEHYHLARSGATRRQALRVSVGEALIRLGALVRGQAHGATAAMRGAS